MTTIREDALLMVRAYADKWKYEFSVAFSNLPLRSVERHQSYGHYLGYDAVVGFIDRELNNG